MILDNDQLFLAIADKRSISKAAKELHISQSTLSTLLGKLEASLGVKLFDRSKHPMVLTYAGRRYYRYAMQHYSMTQSMLEEFDNLDMPSRPRLRIALPSWKSSFFVDRVIPQLLDRFPDLDLRIVEGDVKTTENLLLSRAVDLCVSSSLRYNEKIIYENILQERILLVGNRNHPIVRQHPSTRENPSMIDIHLLENERFFLNSPEQTLHDTIMNLFYKHHMFPKFITYTSLTLTQVNLVIANTGSPFLLSATSSLMERLHRKAVSI